MIKKLYNFKGSRMFIGTVNNGVGVSKYIVSRPEIILELL